MIVLCVIVFAVWLISFLARPTLGGGWQWDGANALGFAALAGLLYLALPLLRQRDMRRHERLGYLVLALAMIHGLWFLLADQVAGEFVLPGAPLYMWLGVVSLILLIVLILRAMLPTRTRWHKRYIHFRYWHQALALGVIAAAVYHIIGSGFYLSTWFQATALVVLAVATSLTRYLFPGQRQPALASPLSMLLVSAFGVAIFTLVRNLP